MGYDFELAGRTSVVHPVHGDDDSALSIDGQRVCARLTPTGSEGEYRLELDGQSERVHLVSRGDVHFVHLRGRSHRVEAINALERARREAEPSGGAVVLRAPMPGVVVEVSVEAGTAVEAGAHLMTIESMKLQTAITAPHAAQVEAICIEPGSTFDQGDALVRLAPDDDPESDESDA